jgi:hypothetical protein
LHVYTSALNGFSVEISPEGLQFSAQKPTKQCTLFDTRLARLALIWT